MPGAAPEIRDKIWCPDSMSSWPVAADKASRTDNDGAVSWVLGAEIRVRPRGEGDCGPERWFPGAGLALLS